MSDELFEEAAQLSRARASEATKQSQVDEELAAFDDSFSDLGNCERCNGRTADHETKLCWYCQNPWASITDELFGSYTCTICPSYGHPTSMHTGRG